MPQKVRGCMLGFDAPFNPLRVKGAHGRGRKERKIDSKDDGDDPNGDGLIPPGPLDRSNGWRLIWQLCDKGVKKIYCTLLIGLRVPPLSPRNFLEYSLLSGGEDKEASDPSDNSDKASS
ncbi:hypothetical protein HAX54_023578 [Datura stramonium]|uniref:Uncharacterized protein n=1 Tax=Datura stramonium TaxID=4076 RepID=A0ABS8UWJ0_DATST|nr:hypothetical protein [Datura stramonium]